MTAKHCLREYMKAIVFTHYGSPGLLEYKEVEKPAPQNNEVLVKVCAASINSWDWEILQGKPFINRLMFGLLKPKKINILGCDITGQVAALGKNVKHLQIGDDVFGDLSACGWGGFAEYVCAPEAALSLKPASITFEEAAAVPQAGLLALQGLHYKEQLQAGQKVLINGAGGGVGSFAVQIAKLFGAEVTAVDSTEKLTLMRLLGADQVIDYTQEDFTRNGQRYDFILDINARHSIVDCHRALHSKGSYIMVGGSSKLISQLLLLGPILSLISNKKMGLLLHKANKGMTMMNALLESTKVVPIIDRRYHLSDTAEAMRYFGKGKSKGKVVIKIAS